MIERKIIVQPGWQLFIQSLQTILYFHILQHYFIIFSMCLDHTISSIKNIYKFKPFNAQATVEYWATYEFTYLYSLLSDIFWRRKMMKYQTAVYLASFLCLGTSYLILEECNKGKWNSLLISFWLPILRNVYTPVISLVRFDIQNVTIVTFSSVETT